MDSEFAERDIFTDFGDYSKTFIPDYAVTENLNRLSIKERYLDFRVSGAQRIMRWLIANQYDERRKFIINAAPGFGKTILMLLACELFSEELFLEHGSQSGAPILVLTFTSNIFLHELYSRVIFRHIDETAQGRLHSLFKLLDKTFNLIAREQILDDIKEMFKLILHQVSSFGDRGLRMIFQGHQQFVISVFGNTSAKILEETMNQGPLYKLHEYIQNAANNGLITVNHNFIDSLKNGIIVVDELQNLHHGALNSRGIALLYVLQVCPEMRFIAADGTLIQNVPEEAITMLQFCFPNDDLSVERFFTSTHDIIPSAQNELIWRGAKCILSFPNNNVSAPKLYILGEPLRIVIEKK